MSSFFDAKKRRNPRLLKEQIIQNIYRDDRQQKSELRNSRFRFLVKIGRNHK